MTANELQKIVRSVANWGWCRYWLYINRPQNPVKMAIQVKDWDGTPLTIKYLSNYEHDRNYLYEIPRTNEDGTDFESYL